MPPPRLLIPACLATAGILVAIQFTTLERVKGFLLRDPDATTTSLGVRELLSSVLGSLTAGDWILGALLGAVLAALVVAEIRGRVVSGEITSILESERGAVLLLAALAAAAGRFYIAPGEFAMGDSPIHVTRVHDAAASLADGVWPFWSFRNHAGYPLLQFYSPLFFVLAGAVSLVTGHALWVIKALLFLAHVGSALALYGWSRALGSSRGPSLVAGLALALSFQHTHTILWAGALPAALVYVFFPLLLMGIEKTLSGSHRWILLVAGSTAALVLSHHGYAAYGLTLAALYLALRWLLASGGRPAFGRVLLVGLGVGAGIVACAGYLWPLLTEGDWVHHPRGLPFLIPGLPSPGEVSKAVVWRNLWSGWSFAYAGVSLLAFSLFGSIRGWIRRRKGTFYDARWMVFFVAAYGVLASVHGKIVVNLVLVLLAMPVAGFTGFAMRRWPRGILIPIVILLADLGPTTIQAAYRGDRAFLREAMAEAGRLATPHRALVAYHNKGETHVFNWQTDQGAGLNLIVGGYPQGVGRSLNPVTAMVDGLNIEGPTATARDLLYLWDVAAMLTASRAEIVAPPFGEPSGTDPPLGWFRPASPLVFSRALAPATDDSLRALEDEILLITDKQLVGPRRAYGDRVRRWVRRMGLDRAAATAEVFLHREDDGDLVRSLGTAPPAALAEKIPPFLHVTSFDVSQRSVRITYEAGEAGYLRAAFSWYPALRVRVDGRPVESAPSLLGAMLLRTEAGSHTLEIVPYVTAGRRVSAVIGALFALAFLLSVAMWRRRTPAG